MAGENLNPETAMLGVKLATLAAGFAGAVVSLSYIKPLSKLQAVMSVCAGMLSSAYLTPAAMYYIELPPEAAHLENGVAFFIGLGGMHIIPALLSIAERFRHNTQAQGARND